MAVEEFVVIMDQESTGLLKNSVGTWNGAAAEEELVVAPKRAIFLTVNAETSLKAIRAAQGLFPGWTKTKVIAVKKELVEEV